MSALLLILIILICLVLSFFVLIQNPKGGGMAGTFGHEKGNQTVSKSLFDASWKPVLDSRPKEQILATGFSCRCQSKRFAEASLKHPIQIIADLFK